MTKRTQPIRRYVVVGGFILILILTVARPMIHYAGERVNVSRVRADLRSMAMALENYRVDAYVYPAAELYRLTTPIQYLQAIPHDPFKSVTFGRDYTTYFIQQKLWKAFLIPAALLACALWPWMRRRTRENFAIAAAMIALAIVLALDSERRAQSWTGYPIRNDRWSIDKREYEYSAHPRLGYVLRSVGPDGAMEGLEFSAAKVGDSITTETLTLHSYDPTNGAGSAGDLFRVSDGAVK